MVPGPVLHLEVLFSEHRNKVVWVCVHVLKVVCQIQLQFPYYQLCSLKLTINHLRLQVSFYAH